MRTTVTIDEKLVRELMELSHAKNKTSAVTSAVREQIRMTKLKKLSNLLGTIDVDTEAVGESDKLDLLRTRWLSGIGDKNGK